MSSLQKGDLLKTFAEDNRVRYFIVVNSSGNISLVGDPGQSYGEIVQEGNLFKIRYRGEEYRLEYVIPKDNPNIVHLLFITIREDYGGDKPTYILAANTWEGLTNKFREYLQKYKYMEDYLEEDEKEETINDIIEKFETYDYSSPELNSTYILDHYVTTTGDLLSF